MDTPPSETTESEPITPEPITPEPTVEAAASAPLSILYRDEDLVVIDKPSGMPVHRSREHARVDRVVLQTLRDQLGRQVFPVHRLDRATSGVIALALSSEGARALQTALDRDDTRKRYVALVRGVTTEGEFEVERPLKKEKSGPPQHSHTRFRRLGTFAMGGPFGKGSVVTAELVTGRRHQIRRHLSGLRHQVLVDSTYGKGAINRWARDELGFKRLCLHASHLELQHPRTGERLVVYAPLPADLAEPLGRIWPDLALFERA